MDFTIGELRVVVSKDYQLYFDSPVGSEQPHMPTISTEDINVLKSILSKILKSKMLDDIDNETDEQKEVRKKTLVWLDNLKGI